MIYPVLYQQFLAPFAAQRRSRCRCRTRRPSRSCRSSGSWPSALNIVVGFAGLLDLGYVAFYAIGAYTAAFLASPHFGSVGITLLRVRRPGFPGIHLPFWLIVPLAVVVAATFGALLGAPTLRLRGDYLAIVTLGFGEIVPVVFKNLSASRSTSRFGPDPSRSRTQPDRRRRSASTRSTRRHPSASSSVRLRHRARSTSA